MLVCGTCSSNGANGVSLSAAAASPHSPAAPGAHAAKAAADTASIVTSVPAGSPAARVLAEARAASAAAVDKLQLQRLRESQDGLMMRNQEQAVALQQAKAQIETLKLQLAEANVKALQHQEYKMLYELETAGQKVSC